MAGAVPKQHVAACDTVDIGAQVTVGAEYNIRVGGEGLYDLAGVARCHQYVTESLYLDGCVYIADYGITRMCLYEFFECICRTAVGQRATCLAIGNEDCFVRAEYFYRLSHEIHAAHYNNVGSGAAGCGLLCESERVSDIVGDILKGAVNIVMGKNDGVFFFLQLQNFGFQSLCADSGRVAIASVHDGLYVSLPQNYKKINICNYYIFTKFARDMQKTAQQIFQAAGIRPTPNRILVMRALLGAACPMGLAELEDALPTMEKSSIFRVLNLLLENHLLHGIEDGRGLTKYEVCQSEGEFEDDDTHPHFYCTECRRVFCIHTEQLPKVELPEGFKAETVNYMIKGLCPGCSGKKV